MTRTVLLGTLGLVLAVATGLAVHLLTRETIALPVVRLEQDAGLAPVRATTAGRTTTVRITTTARARTTTAPAGRSCSRGDNGRRVRDGDRGRDRDGGQLRLRLGRLGSGTR